MRIEIDYDGYPTEASLEELRKCTDPKESLDAVRGYFDYVVYGDWRVKGTKKSHLHLITGGWSGCESVINAINPVVHGLLWESSHRGGLHVYRIPK